MPANYLDTPATERDGDVSIAQMPALDFSIVQPFASPSKNPAEDLRNHMRGIRNGARQQQPVRTPRARSALLSKPNPAGPAQQEFTPLLRSARRKDLLRRSMIEEKENALGSDVPPTPAGFRSSYGGDATQLPMNSSMLDENTGSSIGGAAAVPHNDPISSSMLSATPMPALPRDGQGGVLDQGNVLSLRDQEAKLDQVQKENFGLKLKIHFLEEALRKTGSEYHQATLKENAELKTERLTIDADTKRQKKRFLVLEQECEEYRRKYQEVLTTGGKQDAKSKAYAEQIAALQSQAEESQRLADERLRDIEDLRTELAEAQHSNDSSDEVQELKEDIDDLNRELRDRDSQLDAKSEQLEVLQAELREVQGGSKEMEHMQEDIDELEAELKEREAEIDTKNAKINDLEARLSNVSSSQDAVADVKAELSGAETELRHKTDALDKAVQHIAQLKERLQTAEAAANQAVQEREREVEVLQSKLESVETKQNVSSKQREDALRHAQQEITDKEGEIRALRERLSTARGSWDAEAQQTDARLQERDRLIKERDQRLREKSQIIEQRNDELADLQQRLRSAEGQLSMTVEAQTKKINSLSAKIFELEQTLRSEEAKYRERLSEKDQIIETKSTELKTLRGSDAFESKSSQRRIHELETNTKQLEATNREQARRLTSLQGQLSALETPSRKNALLKEQTAEITKLKHEIQALEKSRNAEVAGLEQELEQVEKEKIANEHKAKKIHDLESKVNALLSEKEGLERKVDRLNERARVADKDQSILGHQTDELGEKQAKIEALEDEIDKMETACRGHERQTILEIERLRAEFEADTAATRQAMEDDIVMLESALDEADAEREAAVSRVTQLEQDLKLAQAGKESGTPARERSALRAKMTAIETERDALLISVKTLSKASQTADTLQAALSKADLRSQQLQEHIAKLEVELQTAREERTIADERQDLHHLVKQAKIEAEELQIKLNDRDRKINASSKREGELRGQLEAAQLEAEDLHAHISELEAKVNAHTAREKQLRTQLREYKDTGMRLEDLEMQLGDRHSSSSGHARREAELRSQLRDAKIGLESLQIELAEKEDRILSLLKREASLRQRLKRGRAVDDDEEARQVIVEDVQAQLDEAEEDVRALQVKLAERERMLSAGQKKELELRSRIKALDQVQQDIPETLSKRHQQEVKGLAKQIRLLRARCTREEGFRKDLVYTKRWFLMQVEMYNECNQADLRLLEEMGITPDQTFRQRKPTLRTLAMTVIATIRMQKMSAAWAENKRMQEGLVKKLEAMKRSKVKMMQ